MAISKDNVQAGIIIPREMKQQLEEIAKQEERSFNNLIRTILKDYLANRTAP